MLPYELEGALMKIRKKTIRVIALVLALSLVGVSAVPARTVCASTCCCKTPLQIPLLDPTSISRITHHIDEHERMHEGSYRVSRYFLLGNTSPGATNCQGTTERETCGMEPLATFQVLQGVIHSAPRTVHVSLPDAGPVVVPMIGKDQLLFGPAADSGMTNRAGPRPLYLQNLSLLI